jgi:colicin import membrane protein
MTSSLAVAQTAPNPGHALADRFAADAERVKAAEAARKDAARQETQRRRKEQAEKAAKEKAQKSWETELQARAKAEADERRQLEIEAARLDALRLAREAQEAEKTKAAEATRQAEQERLAEEARKAADMQRAAEALRVAAEKAAAEESKRKADEAKRIAEAKADEARRAEAARVAEEARRAEQARVAEAARIEEAKRAEAVRKANEELRIATERAAAEEAKRAEEAQRAVQRATDDETRRVGTLEADAEVKRVAEHLRRIREEHLARHTQTAERSVQPTAGLLPPNRLGGPAVATPPTTTIKPQLVAGPLPDSDFSEKDGDDDVGERIGSRVTILLQMEARLRRGGRHESMDPVLCLVDGCYVSNGPDAPAHFMPGRRATRFGNAISRRAGACNHAYTCVFRNVDIGALPAEVQPVDIRVLRHDRREPERIEKLSVCRTMNGRLACKGPITGDGYTMWVIPESVAARVPVELFGSAGEPHAAIPAPRGRW